MGGESPGRGKARESEARKREITRYTRRKTGTENPHAHAHARTHTEEIEFWGVGIGRLSSGPNDGCGKEGCQSGAARAGRDSWEGEFSPRCNLRGKLGPFGSSEERPDDQEGRSIGGTRDAAGRQTGGS